jgi:Flp pilus assembly protein TadD
LRDAVIKNPKAWAAHNDLGCFLAQRNCFPEAIDHFATSLKYKPEHIEAHVNLGQVLLRMGRVDDAETNFTAALHFKPGCADAHCGYAKVLALRNKRVEAICHLRSALVARPDAQTGLQLAGMLYQSRDRRGAIRQLRTVTELNEEIPEAFSNLAWLLATSPDAALRDGRQAIHYARRACRLTHYKEAQMVATLAAAYAEAGRFEDATRTAEIAIQLATRAGQTEFASINEQLLKLYRQGRPFHENPDFPKGK